AATEELVASDYQVNIYRARPVIVIDGMSRQKVMTPYQTGTQIAKHAGVALYPEDTTEFERADSLATEGVGLLLVVDRATPFEFTFYGKTTTARTQGVTVGEMLKEKGIDLNKNDRVLPDANTKLTSGMDIKVWREGKQTITVDEAVKFETEEIKDADREVGYHEVRTIGEEGSRTVTYEVVIKDGEEVSRTEIASITIKQPKKQVEIIGTKVNVMPYTGGGSKTEWLAASNIPEDSWGYVDFMVGRESSWNPNAINVSSGACGLAQALPCSKVPGNPYDPVNSLNWMNGYVNGRYGGWQGAYDFWVANRWY
ncbi:MAG TPA: G5 domain-containing protein, partial [Candidatus Saccharimonadales bacterium]|nr:G5 domain-containing protein [Candidatus Saccharimonadales bacterium]